MAVQNFPFIVLCTIVQKQQRTPQTKGRLCPTAGKILSTMHNERFSYETMKSISVTGLAVELFWMLNLPHMSKLKQIFSVIEHICRLKSKLREVYWH